MNRNYWIGIGASLASAFLWSTVFVCGRYLLAGHRIDPVSLSLFRFALGGTLLLTIAGVTMPRRLLAVRGGELARLAALGLVGIAGMSVLVFWGQCHTTAINSSLIMQLNPFLILFLGVLLGERAGGRQVGSALLALTGCLLVVEVISTDGFHYDAGRFQGDLLILLSAACWAVYSVLGRHLVRRHGGLVCTTWAMLFGTVELALLYPFCAASRIIPAVPADWLMILYLGIFPTGLAFWAWYEGMARIGLPLLSIMQYLSPAFTVLLAMLLLGERLSPMRWGGIVLILGSIVLAGWVTGPGHGRPAR